MHELGHSFGLDHSNQRHDAPLEEQKEPFLNPKEKVYFGPHDKDSNMTIPEYSGQKYKDGSYVKNQNLKLSARDKMLLNLLYPACPKDGSDYDPRQSLRTGRFHCGRDEVIDRDLTGGRAINEICSENNGGLSCASCRFLSTD